MVSVKTSGSFKNTTGFLTRAARVTYASSLEKHGAAGVAALSSGTPVDSAETARSWSYEIKQERGRVEIAWHNDHRDGGAPVAVLIQYGHATRSGAFVQGRDFINPAIRPIFEQIADDVWKEVTK